MKKVKLCLLAITIVGCVKCTTDGPAPVKNGYSRLEMAHGVYEGQLKNDTANGLGCYKRNDGTWYVGEWKDNQWNGLGKAYWASGQFVGDSCLAYFENNELNGFAHYYHREGAQYIGFYEHGCTKGIGKLVYKGGMFDGDIYLGNWKKCNMYGWGRYYDASIREYRTGIFSQDHSFRDSLIRPRVFDSLENILQNAEHAMKQEFIRLTK